MIRLLVADDLPSARKGLRVLIAQREDMQLVGEASSGPEAVALTRAHHPDVVLMDVRMPGGDGIQATREISAPGFPARAAVVVMTTFEEDEYLFGALEAGAVGFIPKTATPAELTAAVRLAATGRSMLSPSIAHRVISEFARLRHANAELTSATAHPTVHVPAEGVPALTTREVEVLQHLARGLSDTEIAAQLHVEKSTVKWHLSQIRAKTASRNRTALLVWALRAGLV